jgi:hypothetical protein
VRTAARALVAALVLVALVRAVSLELDPYDAYEVRSSARAVAGDRESPFFPYRSALLGLVEAPLEGLARGSRATWVFPHVLTALAYGGLALAAVALARAAGASREASWAAGAAVALDRLAFADAPLGLPDGLAAALGTAGLARGVTLLDVPERRHALAAGALLGLAAAARPNAGLACGALGIVALVLELRRGKSFLRGKSPLRAVILVSVIAVTLYFLVETLYFTFGKGSLSEGRKLHAVLARFQRDQFAENALKYGIVFPPIAVYARAAFFMEPATTLLAPVGIGLALSRGGRREAVLVLAALVQVAFLATVVGHGEARYLLGALVALAGLGALALDRLASAAILASEGGRARARVAAAVVWIALPLGLGARFEAERVRDPVLRENFSARVADAVVGVSSSTAGVSWVPDLPFPVYPDVLAREGTPFRGDPFHGIFHAGPVTVGYHLGRPIRLLRRRDERGDPAPGIGSVAELEAVVRASPANFHDGDVVLFGVATPGLSWQLSTTPPALKLLRVRGGSVEVVGEISRIEEGATGSLGGAEGRKARAAGEPR